MFPRPIPCGTKIVFSSNEPPGAAFSPFFIFPVFSQNFRLLFIPLITCFFCVIVQLHSTFFLLFCCCCCMFFECAISLVQMCCISGKKKTWLCPLVLCFVEKKCWHSISDRPAASLSYSCTGTRANKQFKLKTHKICSCRLQNLVVVKGTSWQVSSSK